MHGRIQLNILPVISAAALTALIAAPGRAADKAAGGEEDATALAKETQNPVANLISVPFQNNFNFNTGTTHATQSSSRSFPSRSARTGT